MNEARCDPEIGRTLDAADRFKPCDRTVIGCASEVVRRGGAGARP